jgi:hypothetical protein
MGVPWIVILVLAGSTLELGDLYQALADTMAQIIGGDGCYITQVGEVTGQVLGGAAYGVFRDTYRQLRPPRASAPLPNRCWKPAGPWPS